MIKTPPCTLGPKHKWTWVRNFTQSSITYLSRGSSCRISLKGEYKCECGQTRVGQSNHNGPDLRQLVDKEAS